MKKDGQVLLDRQFPPSSLSFTNSGTTLMYLLICRSLHASCLTAKVPEAEGQHLQLIYDRANSAGGMFLYAYAASSHMTEQDPKVSAETAVRLFGSWAPYWNTSAPLLVEKSPPHMLKTRFFQALFSKDRTRFVIMLRHPLGVSHFHYTKDKYRIRAVFKSTCGSFYLRHWIQLHNILLHDLEFGLVPEHVMIVPFEHFMGYGLNEVEGQLRMRRLLDKVDTFLNITSHADIVFVKPNGTRVDKDGDNDDPYEEEKGGGEIKEGTENKEDDTSGEDPEPRIDLPLHGRDLLGYWGNRNDVTVVWGDPMRWVKDFEEGVNLKGPVCRKLIWEAEPMLNMFGYSMRNLSVVNKPQIKAANLLWLD